MKEEWIDIPHFENYALSNTGLVRRNFDGRLLARVRNKQGVLFVGLSKNSRQYSRAIAHLVADLFLPPSDHPWWDTPVHLDGDRTNCSYKNLVWRPRWFAIQYHQQVPDSSVAALKLRETTSGEIMILMDFAMKYGVLPLQLYIGAWNYTHHNNRTEGVWPTGLMFEIV
jgi:hypothetical protein